jgi:aspartyl-tRNA(Asn)/glutamyl-tRNA(Gln) amidotransferase subunit A
MPAQPPTALELGRMLAAGEADPVTACEEALERAASDAARHAFIALTAERARGEAARSAQRHAEGRPLGSLDGVPVAVKDLFDVRGTPTTAASATRRDATPAPDDAPAIAALAAAGMVCVGKTNLTEFAFSGLGLNPHFGTPRNPYGGAVARIPGGSSSGSAVAVAAGVVPCAIGTDTSGSVRVPAAFCGLVGFKPTSARVDRTGVFPLAPTLDSVGPLARSVADALAIDAAMRGLEPRPAQPADLGQLVLVVPEGRLVDEVEHGVAARVEAAVVALAGAGARIERRALRALDEAMALRDSHGTIVAAEAWRIHAELVSGPRAHELDPRVLARIRAGRAVLEGGYGELLERRGPLQRLLTQELGGAPAVLATVRHTAPELEPLERDDELFSAVNMSTLRATMAASYLDMPGVSLPVGLDEEGLPVGLLICGAPGDDDRVLAAALAAEAALRGAWSPGAATMAE